MNPFEPIWKKRREIDDAYKILWLAARESIKGKVFESKSQEYNALKEAMGDYQIRVYYPAMKQLREDCAKLGHHEGNYDQHYHDNGLGWSRLCCSYCREHLKVWLDGVELKVENGQAINNGKNWIKVDGSIGPSCVDEEE